MLLYILHFIDENPVEYLRNSYQETTQIFEYLKMFSKDSSKITYLCMIRMCYLVCLFQQVPQHAQASHPELVPSAHPVQPAVFSSPLQNGSDPAAAAQLDNKNPCQLALQAQSQVQSQIPVLQPSDSQRVSSGSASSSLTQQKQLSSLTGAAGQGPTETNTEVWTHTVTHFYIF